MNKFIVKPNRTLKDINKEKRTKEYLHELMATQASISNILNPMPKEIIVNSEVAIKKKFKFSNLFSRFIKKYKYDITIISLNVLKKLADIYLILCGLYILYQLHIHYQIFDFLIAK